VITHQSLRYYIHIHGLQALHAVQKIMVWIERSAPLHKQAAAGGSSKDAKPSPCPLAVVCCLHLLRGQVSKCITFSILKDCVATLFEDLSCMIQSDISF
jgi:hypothetical protein